MVPKLQNILPPGWKNIIAHYEYYEEENDFYISPDGLRFNSMEKVKQFCSQSKVYNRREQQMTNNEEANPFKIPRLSDKTDVSYANFVAKNDQIMISKDVAKTRKHHSKRFSSDSLLKRTLKKEEFRVRENFHKILLV